MKDMKDSEYREKYNLSEILLPIILCKNKNKNLNILDFYNEVESQSIDISLNIESFKNKKIKKDFKHVIKKILIDYLVFEITYNDSYYLEDFKKNIVDIFSKTKNNYEDSPDVIVSNDIFLMTIVSGLLAESNKYHSSLYLSGFISFEKMKELNEKISINVIKNINSTLHYLNFNKKNDNTFIYDIIKITSNIYIDIFNTLFKNLSENEDKTKRYISNQDKYIAEVNNIFIEQYSSLNIICNKINKKNKFEIKNDEE